MPTLTITYTPGFTSDPVNSSPFICHRVCYRQQGETDYCCTEDDTASVAGTPKTFIVDLDASPGCATAPAPDPQTCIVVSYEGYVQACCEASDSIEGRVSWTAGFTPDPDCVNKLVCCTAQRSLDFGDFIITNAGGGYDDLLTPLAVSIIRDASDPVPAGGTNDAVVTVNIVGGIIDSFNRDVSGLYGVPPLVVIPSPTLGGPVQATAYLYMPCSNPYAVIDCEGNETVLEDSLLQLGGCQQICFPKTFPFIYTSGVFDVPNTTDYSYVQQGCCDCTTCRDYTVVTNSLLSEITLAYYGCENGEVPSAYKESVPLSGSGSHNITCAVPGSIFCIDDPTCIVSISDNGECGGCGGG